MKLHELKEESIGDVIARWKPKTLTEEEMMAWMKKNAPLYLEDGNPIYRSTHEGQSGLMDTLGLKRTSANTFNYYNLWIDNHESWKNYPKRSQSLICSTDKYTVEAFGGETYLVIPKDKSIVGVCPAGDMWGSFHEVYTFTGDSDNLGILMDLFHASFDKANPKEWSSLVKILKETPTSKFIKTVETDQGLRVDAEWVDSCPTVYEIFEHIFDPRRNGFTTRQSQDLNDGEHEVWVSGREILMIDLNNISEKMEQFLGHHLVG